MFGTEPTARMQWEPSTVRPSVSVTVTVPPSRRTDSIRELRQHVHPAPEQDLLEHGRGVGVLAGQHPVAARDQGDPAAEREVGTGELGAGDAEPTTIRWSGSSVRS